MINKEKLANGLTVVTESIDHMNSVSMGIWVNAGSRDESKEMAGISHFLEHMNFKGTEKRSAKDLAESLESRGGHLNAYTTKEYTSYYCQVVEEDWALGLDVLSDLYLHSRFLKEDIEKEKNVVVEEINLYEDSPEDLVVDMLNGLAWGEYSLARPILGNEEAVTNFTPENLFAYRKSFYTPENTVLAVAGNLNHEKVIAEAEKLFGDFSGEKIPSMKENPQCLSGKVEKFKDIMQEHICMGFPGVSIYHPHYFPLVLVNEILGGGASSRLFQSIREEMALSYAVFSFMTSYRDCGMISIYAGTSKDKGETVIEKSFEEIALIQQKGVSEDELEKLKGQISGSMRIGLDSLGSRINRLGRNEMYYGRHIPIEEVVESINKVTNEDMMEVANTYLKREQVALALLGGIK